jgi:hypothetical protein
MAGALDVQMHDESGRPRTLRPALVCLATVACGLKVTWLTVGRVPRTIHWSGVSTKGLEGMKQLSSQRPITGPDQSLIS